MYNQTANFSPPSKSQVTTPGIAGLGALNQPRDQMTHECGSLPLALFFHWPYTESTLSEESVPVVI